MSAKILNKIHITRPTLLSDEKKARKNIKRMADKAKRSHVKFRPHFKTHQSAQIGEWFRDAGIDRITVSSVDMAVCFARQGWKNITIAFPVNILEIERINRLVESVELHLLLESPEVVSCLDTHLTSPVNIWIKIDTGSRRTGINWQDPDKVLTLASGIEGSKKLNLTGLLTHAGHTYGADIPSEILKISTESVARLNEMRNALIGQNFKNIQISIGDTPGCSLLEKFENVEEIRPGNFVFYDAMQFNLKSCTEEEIALVMVCPVVATHPERDEFIIHGGAVHLSKDYFTGNAGEKIFGLVCLLEKNGWGKILQDTWLSAVSQEHGIIRSSNPLFKDISIGDVIAIIPAHSCLAVDLMREIQSTEGENIKISPKFSD